MRFAGYCWRSNNELVSDGYYGFPNMGSAGRPAKTFADQMVEDTECEVEELINLMDNRDEWKKCVLECRASSTL